MKVEDLLFEYVEQHGLLSSKQDIESFNNWCEENKELID